MSTISGGGMSPLGGPNWDPNMIGGDPKPEEINDTEHIDTIGNIDLTSDKTDSASATGKKQESVVRSSSSLEHFSETQLNKKKLEKAQEKMGPLSKLKQSMHKMKSGMKAFLSGFGSRGASVSVRKSKDSGEGTSMIPSELPSGSYGKSPSATPRMMDFYLDASGMARSDSDKLELDTGGVSSSSSFTAENSIFSQSANMDDIFAASMLFSQAKTTLSPDNLDATYQSWTAERLGGEFVSRLVDPNMETASLLRRAPLLDYEGSVDFVIPDPRTPSSTAFFKKQTNEDLIDEMNNPSKGDDVTLETGEAVEELEKEEDKKDLADKIAQEQIENQKAKERLLLSAVPPGGFPYIGSTSITSGSLYKFRLPDSSGESEASGVLGKDVHIREDGFDITSSRDRSRYFSSKSVGNDAFVIEKKSSLISSYHYEPSDTLSSSFSDFGYGRQDDNSNEIQINTKSSSFSKASLEEPLEKRTHITSSSYLFSAFQGMAFQLPPPRSKHEYITEIKEIPGLNAPPDPLIYQYRNVAVNPPLVLRPYTPYGEGSSKMGIQGKPEAASAHNDAGDDNNDRERQEENIEEEIEEIAEDDDGR